jgi:hypothetical protein
MAAVDPKNPTSWNQYAYVNGDPVNFNDPDGLDCGDLPLTYNGRSIGTVSSVVNAGDDVALLAEAAFTEAYHGNGSNPSEMFVVADTIMNRWQIVNGYYTELSGPKSSPRSRPTPVIPAWGYPDGGLASIVMNVGQFGIFKAQADGTIALSPSAQATLNGGLGAEPGTSLCDDLIGAIGIAELRWSGRNDHALYEVNGLVVTGFNSFNPPRPSDLNEQRIGSYGASSNVFYGIPDSYFDWNLGQSIPLFPRPPRPRPRPIRH